jgi:hypothetical protein
MEPVSRTRHGGVPRAAAQSGRKQDGPLPRRGFASATVATADGGAAAAGQAALAVVPCVRSTPSSLAVAAPSSIFSIAATSRARRSSAARYIWRSL